MTVADHAATRQLWRDSGLTDEPEDGLEDVARLLDSPQSAGFVAMNGSALIGAVLCGTDGRYGYIHHLATAPGSRRSGVGQALIAACTEFLGTRHVLVFVRDENAPATRFWASAGYARGEGLSLWYRQAHP